MRVNDWLWYPYIVTKLLILLLLPLSVFISFIFSTVSLIKRRKLQYGGDTTRKFWKASVTITLFTAIYLICHLPMFAITAMDCVRVWFDLGHSTSEFLYWYDYLLGELVCTTLDSALNPCLYLWRMADFRDWVFSGTRKYVHVILHRNCKQEIAATKV